MNDLLFYGVPLIFAICAVRMRFLKSIYMLFAIVFGVYFGLYGWNIPAQLLPILDDRLFAPYKKVIAVGMTGFAVYFLFNRLYYNSLASRKLFNFPHAPDKIAGALCGWLAGSIALNFAVFVFTMTPLTDKVTTFSPDLLRDNSIKNMERVTMIVNYASLQKFDREQCEKYLISLRPAPPEPEAPATPATPAKPATTAKPGTAATAGDPNTTTANTGTGTTTTPSQTKTTTTTVPTVKPTPRGEEITLKTQQPDTNIQLKTQPRTKVDIKL